MKFALLAAAALFVGVAPAAAVNLVINGGFESDPAPNGGYIQYPGGSIFTGWTVTGNDVIVIDANYSESGLVFNANSGSNSIDLTGAGNTGPADGITQTVATVAGTSYNVSFFVGNASPTGGNASSYTQPSSVALTLNGGPVSTFTNPTDTPFGINWLKYNFQYIATGPTTLAFTNATVGDNMAGLDDISVEATVPEPATWALLIAGFAMTGVAMRRRAVAA